MPHVETYVDGVWHPSVSTIIHAEPKPWMDAWKEKWGQLAARKLELAGTIGTEFHRRVELFLHGSIDSWNDGLTPNMNRRIDGMVASFIGWARTINGDIHDMELRVISRAHRYSGTLDAVGTFGKAPMLYDWKTSAAIYPEHHLQLAAYAQAYKEQTGIELKQGMIVCVSKDKPRFKLTTKTFKLGKKSFNKFLKLRAKFAETQEGINAEAIESEASGC